MRALCGRFNAHGTVGEYGFPSSLAVAWHRCGWRKRGSLGAICGLSYIRRKKFARRKFDPVYFDDVVPVGAVDHRAVSRDRGFNGFPPYCLIGLTLKALATTILAAKEAAPALGVAHLKC